MQYALKNYGPMATFSKRGGPVLETADLHSQLPRGMQMDNS